VQRILCWCPSLCSFGGVLLALSKNKSSSVSCEEVEKLITAFEKQSDCRISIEMRVGVLAGKPSLELVCHAWNNRTDKAAPPLLASASVRCSALRLGTIEGAIIRVLYALDFQLAWGARTDTAAKEA